MRHESRTRQEEQEEPASWNERLLMAAVIVAMVLSLVGYMHG